MNFRDNETRKNVYLYKRYEGGQFWDGRAANLEEQAKDPFLNPLEMGMKDEAAVIDLGLTEAEIDDIVAFMLTLTDGYAPANGR